MCIIDKNKKIFIFLFQIAIFLVINNENVWKEGENESQKDYMHAFSIDIAVFV